MTGSIATWNYYQPFLTFINIAGSIATMADNGAVET